MKNKKTLFAFFSAFLISSTILFAQGQPLADIKDPDKKTEKKAEKVIGLSFIAEIGFLAVLDHKIQFGKANQYFNYVTEGGQNTLNFFGRLSADMFIKKNHVLTFLYQPLEINGQEKLTRAVTMGSVNFAINEVVKTRYSFPFYRLTYMYDFIDDEKLEVALGLGLQIRNATIEFSSLTTPANSYVTANIGPVPLIRFRVKYVFSSGFLLGTDLAGFYAPISVLNGGDKEIEGAIADLSIFTGYRMNNNFDFFLNVRYLGGGAAGFGSPGTQNPDGYTKNWLHFMSVSLGVSLNL